MERVELAMVAHEVGGPLATVRGAYQLLEPDSLPLDARQRKLFRLLGRGLDRADRVLENLAALTQPHSIEPAVELNLIRTLEAVLEDHQCRRDSRSLDCEVQVASQAQCLPVSRGILEQILSNLISNAFKYSPDGGKILLQAAAMKTAVIPGRLAVLAGLFDFQPRYTAIRVINDGPALTAETRSKLFQPFFRGAEAVHTKGTGLGLAIARRLAGYLHGDLRAEERESGVSFLLTLPGNLETLKLSERIASIAGCLDQSLAEAPQSVAVLRGFGADHPPQDIGPACTRLCGAPFQAFALGDHAAILWSAVGPKTLVRTLFGALVESGGEALCRQVHVSLRRAQEDDRADGLILQLAVRAKRALRAQKGKGGLVHGADTGR